MLHNISRFIWPVCRRHAGQPVLNVSTAITIAKGGYVNKQMDYIRSTLENNIEDWDTIKKKALTIPGAINEKNVNGVLLKVMISEKKLETAKLFAKYLKSCGEQLNLGTINGLLFLYYKLGMENQLTDDEKKFILDTYKNLYKKYEVLDFTTCERLLHALCVIDEWKKALRVLEDIHVTCSPTHSAYNMLIATLFKLNKKSEALKMIEKSLCNQRSLQHIAYEAWINYILRKYKDPNYIAKYLDEICLHISKNGAVIPEQTAQKLRVTYAKLGWQARYTKIRKNDGQCVYCRTTLNCLKLSEEEFQMLQKTVKDKIIVGSDILLKTNPEELKRFTDFMERTEPFDIVIDALNVCYATGVFKVDKVGPLTFVVEHFRQQNKKILMIGRKHMLKWPRIKYLLNTTSSFFTDDISEDDPYFITAAILSGSHTDFVSKDLLRGHRFQLQDEQLRHLFQRWQWQHQWKVFMNRSGSPQIQPPLPVTPCAQKKDYNWHLPFEREDTSDSHGRIRDGTPDWASWLCLQSNR